MALTVGSQGEKEPYYQGMVAHTSGQPADSNPYDSRKQKNHSAFRLQWFDGFYDARIRERLGPVFRKHNLTW